MQTLLIIFTFVKKYWWAILILLVFVGFGLAKHYKNQRDQETDRANRWKSNHDELKIDYKKTRDEKGRLQSRVKTLRVTKKELQSDLYEKQGVLAKLKEELEYSQVKIKDLEQSLIAELNSSNQGTTIIQDTVFIEKPKQTYDYIHIDDDYLNLKAWWIDPDSVDWFYNYNETILYWTELQPQVYNEDGNKRFFLWRWIWPKKQPETFIKSTNPNSEIEATEVEVKDN